MLFEGLSGKLQEAMKKLRGKGILEADVNFKVVKDFIGKVSERAVGQEVLSMKSLSTSWVLQTAR